MKCHHFDFALKVQKTFEKTYCDLIEFYAKKTHSTNIVLSGGCSLNVLANYKLSQRNEDFNLYVFPAASDRGLSVGNAILGGLQSSIKLQDLSNLSFGLGNKYSNERIFSDIQRSGLTFRFYDDKLFYMELARLILDGNVAGFFEGRSEYGPRALGFRSIIANARCNNIKDTVNQKIKFREKYRPFAPALLEEDFLSLSEDYRVSPYMTVAFDVSDNSELFGETMHQDGTARVQTVDSHRSPYFYSLLCAMKEIQHQIPCILNTSFNLSGEPIVESPSDALRTFISSDLDLLAIGNYIVNKSNNN